MPHHHEIRRLPYSAEQMYELVGGIERYPEFLPWCKSINITSRDKNAVIADMVVGYKIFQEKFTSEVTLDRPCAIIVHYRSGPLSHLSNEWQFTPVSRKACEIAFTVDFDFRSPLLRAATNIFFDKALSKMVAAFEARAKELYG